MTKQEIKKVLKDYEYTVITKSWYNGTKGCYLFNAYNCHGECYRFWIDEPCEYATKQPLSDVCILDEQNISRWFWK